jgi:hypothetical protein
MRSFCSRIMQQKSQSFQGYNFVASILNYETGGADAVQTMTHNFMDLPLAAHGAKIRQVAAGFVEPAGANRVTLADDRTAAPGRPQGGRLRVRHSQASASPMGGCNATQHRTPVARHCRDSRPWQHRHRLRAAATRTAGFRSLYPAPPARGDRTGGPLPGQWPDVDCGTAKLTTTASQPRCRRGPTINNYAGGPRTGAQEDCAVEQWTVATRHLRTLVSPN